MLREDGHLDPSSLSSLRLRLANAEDCLRERIPGIALAHPPKTRLMWRQADAVHAELRSVQQRYSLHPVDGTYNAATLRFIGVTQLPPDEKVGGRQPNVEGAYPATYEQVMSSSTATDIIAEGIDDNQQTAPTPLVNIPSPAPALTPKHPRMTPMALMDEGTPLTPRTRLILGIGPDPDTPVIAMEQPNALYGSMEPGSPLMGSPLSPDKATGANGDTSSWAMQDQILALQTELLTQRRRAEDSNRQVEEAKSETQNLRSVVSVLEDQMRAIQGGHRGPAAPMSPAGADSGAASSRGIGLTILDVLGLMWLVHMFQSFAGGNTSIGGSGTSGSNGTIGGSGTTSLSANATAPPQPTTKSGSASPL